MIIPEDELAAYLGKSFRELEGKVIERAIETQGLPDRKKA